MRLNLFMSHGLRLLAIAGFASAITAEATVHRVMEGESIQAAIDVAAPGDTILVEPGEYIESAGSRYGLRVTTNNLRLIGKARNSHGHRVKYVCYSTALTTACKKPACTRHRPDANTTSRSKSVTKSFTVSTYAASALKAFL